jgi:hypothetical protein
MMVIPDVYVLFVSGHRSFGDGGNPVERERTDDLAREYVEAFRKAGYACDWFQNIDGDSDPTMTAGGLDGVARGVQRIIASRKEKLVIMLDLHFNGRRSGVHSIVAHNMRLDGRGPLSTAYAAGRDATDLFTNNPLDVDMAYRISTKIVQRIEGMYIWKAGRSGLNGVMLENETGVGNNDGVAPDNARLAMMSATAPSRFKAVRITVEHGGTDDASRPNFYEKCALAALEAVNDSLAARAQAGGGGQPEPEPEPEEPEANDVSLLAWAFGSVDGYVYDPNGPVSKLWTEHGIETGCYPAIHQVLNRSDGRWFQFMNGEVIHDDLKGHRDYVKKFPGL